MGRKKRPSETISFRLDANVLRVLDHHRQAFDVSRGEWVRGVVTNLLDGNTPGNNEQIEQLSSELAASVKLLRTDLSAVLYVILVEVGKVPAESAKGCVREFLLNE